MTGRSPAISVVVPVLNGAETLGACLAALRRSTFRHFEIIVVDDGSSDGTGAIAAAAGVDLVLRNDRPTGCFSARNRGAEAAAGEVLFFTDADVEIAADTLEKVWRHCGREGAGAVIGLYAAEHPHANLSSQYKNAWIRWSYLQHGAEVDWFFTAVGGVRREHWQRIGGFDAGFDRRLGGGDLDFGHRLGRAGVRIALDKSLSVVHLRRFSVASLLRNDFNRSRGWAALGLSRRGTAESAQKGLANVSGGFVASVALAGLLMLTLAASMLRPSWWPAAAVAAAVYLVVSRDFLLWAARTFSPAFALQSLGLQLVDHVICGVGVVMAMISSRRS